VVRAGDQHAEIVAEFFRTVWDPRATAEGVRTARREDAIANPGALGQESPTFLVLLGGRVIGFVSTIPFLLWNGTDERQAYWIKGLMVLPEYRNGPIGFMVLKEALRHLPCATSLTVAPASRRLFEALGFRNMGLLRNYLRLLRPVRVAARVDLALALPLLPRWVSRGYRLAQRTGVTALLGGCVSIAYEVGSLRFRARAHKVTVASTIEPPEHSELDDLWQRVRRSFRAAGVRDGRYLAWRYHSARAGRYRFITARGNGELKGVAVIRRPEAKGDPRLRGLRVAVLSDLLFPVDDAATGNVLVAGAERVARELHADALLVSPSHPAVEAVLRRRMYVGLPGNMYFLTRDSTGTFMLPETLPDWWVMRGDMEADEVF
jgi:ribosomal protein S18 acetylase RimI-like enzyme